MQSFMASEWLEVVQRIVKNFGDIPIKVLNNEGDLFDITEIRFSAMNGGEIHIVADSDEDDY